MGIMTRHVRRALRGVLAAVLLAGAVATASAATASASPGAGAEGGRQTYTGTIDGADYRVEMPERWNGTLVVYSHGYWPAQYPPEGIALSNSPETESWLLDHGYALAASNFRGVTGYQVGQGYEDQLALLDWFETTIGRPERTIATGQSMGGAIAVPLAERNPHLFDGVATVCAGYDAQGTFNSGLDVVYAVRHLLLPPEADVDLVRPASPAEAEADTLELANAVTAALETEEGRARIALIASLNNVTGWWSALAPRPTDPEEIIRQQANWLVGAYVSGFAGPTARVDLEPKAGGNPSSNVGIDYRRQLDRSSEERAVRRAYRAAGLDLRADLDRLNAAPRIAADPAAVDYMYRTGVPTGRLRVPMVTLHSVGDGGSPPDQEDWYAEQVARHGGRDLTRQLYVERGQHCSTSAADELVALRTLERRLDTGRWPSTNPERLDRQVAEFDEQYQLVTDFGGGTWPLPRGVMPPAFTRFDPPDHMRPSR
jgi:pimeloyl-ACP methyl ester carboxylesterase